LSGLPLESRPLCRVAHGDFGRVAAIGIPAPMAPHVHHHCHVLFKAGGPDVSCSVGDRTWRLTDRMAVLVNPWERHHLGEPGDRWPVAMLALYIEPDWLARAFGEPGLAIAQRLFDTPVVALAPGVTQLRNELLDTLTEPPAPGSGQVGRLIMAILSRLLSGDAVGPARAAHGTAPDPRIRRALDIIGDRGGWVTDMGAVAREVGMSRPRFFARFKASTGMSPTLFANHCRVERAAAALERGDVSLADLSLGLGFSEQANFTRFFRRHFGAPPGVYRRGLDVRRPYGRTEAAGAVPAVFNSETAGQDPGASARY
jgi:AraC family transcriptional regulator